VHSTWVPSATGAGFALPDSLTPFADLADYLTVVTGTNHPGSSPGHIPARGIALSSSHDMDTSIEGVGTYRGQNHPEPSLDALVVEHWQGQAAYDSVEVGICRKGPYKSNSSWKRGGTAYNRHEPSPQKVFERLFSGGVPTGTDPALLEVTTKLHKSMLDAVMEDTKSLSARLGATDKLRLEQHLDGLRTIEQRLQQIAAGGVPSCNDPTQPVAGDFGDGSSKELKEDKAQLMSELIATAFACDLTRVFSYEWSATQSHAVYWEVGSSAEHHPLNHDQPGGDEMKAIVKFIMKNFAYLAAQLRDKLEGNGNVLDNTLIVGTSEHANAGSHNYKDHPFVLVGKAGGGIKSGIHYRDSNGSNQNAPRVLLSAARAVGLDIDQLGQAKSDANRVADQVITELMGS
jgi:hypothetical protein